MYFYDFIRWVKRQRDIPESLDILGSWQGARNDCTRCTKEWFCCNSVINRGYCSYVMVGYFFALFYSCLMDEDALLAFDDSTFPWSLCLFGYQCSLK